MRRQGRRVDRRIEDGRREGGNATPLARIVTAGAAGVEPRVMGLGPVPASKKALARAGLALADMDVIKIETRRSRLKCSAV